jgi:PAS domain S-box-containing protein
VAAATAAFLFTRSFTQFRSPFFFFYFAILASGLYGGSTASWITFALGLIPVCVLNMLRLDTMSLLEPGMQSAVLGYFFKGSISVLIVTAAHSARFSAASVAAMSADRHSTLQQEINERRELETKLRRRQQQLELAIEAARLGTFSWAIGSDRVEGSTLNEVMHGFAPGTFNGSMQQALTHVHPDDAAAIRERLAVAHADRSPRRNAYRVIWPDKSVHWIESTGQVVFDDDGKPTHVLGVCVDITDRKLAEDALKASEARLQAILDNAPAVIFLKDNQGRYITLNRRYIELFHVNPDDFVGKTDAELFPAEVAAKFRVNDELVRKAAKPLTFEEVAPHDDGPHTYIAVKFPVKDAQGSVVAIGGVATDISDLKLTTEALKSERQLLRNLINVQENEKRFICYEIHDGLIQHVAGVLMKLEGNLESLAATDAAPVMREAIMELRKAMAEGRRVIRGVRPTVLDDAGISAAIEDLIDHSDDASVKVEFVQGSGIDHLPMPLETAIYRVAQEALTNAKKHSGSDRVRIELRRINGHVHLEVRDFGEGFREAEAHKGTFGLIGMKERVRLLGGTCSIESSPDAGTRVSITLPIGDEEVND